MQLLEVSLRTLGGEDLHKVRPPVVPVLVCVSGGQPRPGPSGSSWSFRISWTLFTSSTLPLHSDISFTWTQTLMSTPAFSLQSKKQAFDVLLRSPAAGALLGLLSSSGIPAGARRADLRPTSLGKKRGIKGRNGEGAESVSQVTTHAQTCELADTC